MTGHARQAPAQEITGFPPAWQNCTA